jgi:hypothetical protein
MGEKNFKIESNIESEIINLASRVQPSLPAAKGEHHIHVHIFLLLRSVYTG